MLLTKIKEFSMLANNASKLGSKDIRLDRDMFIGLLSEINYLMATKIETPIAQPAALTLTRLNGGKFK